MKNYVGQLQLCIMVLAKLHQYVLWIHLTDFVIDMHWGRNWRNNTTRLLCFMQHLSNVFLFFSFFLSLYWQCKYIHLNTLCFTFILQNIRIGAAQKMKSKHGRKTKGYTQEIPFKSLTVAPRTPCCKTNTYKKPCRLVVVHQNTTILLMEPGKAELIAFGDSWFYGCIRYDCILTFSPLGKIRIIWIKICVTIRATVYHCFNHFEIKNIFVGTW